MTGDASVCFPPYERIRAKELPDDILREMKASGWKYREYAIRLEKSLRSYFGIRERNRAYCKEYMRRKRISCPEQLERDAIHRQNSRQRKKALNAGLHHMGK